MMCICRRSINTIRVKFKFDFLIMIIKNDVTTIYHAIRKTFSDMMSGCMRQTYNQHSDQKILLCNLSMGEDIIEHIGHVAFVFFT